MAANPAWRVSNNPHTNKVILPSNTITINSMKHNHHILTILLAMTVLPAGCKLKLPNSCEVGSLRANLTDDELENCKKCGWADCSSHGTDGDGDGDGELFCESQPDPDEFVSCYREDNALGRLVSEWLTDAVLVDEQDCTALTDDVATYDPGHDLSDAGNELVWCSIAGVVRDTVGQLPGWHQCRRVEPGPQNTPIVTYVEARSYTDGPQDSTWTSALECFGGVDVGSCPLGFVSLYLGEGVSVNSCLCYDDGADSDLCLDGSVCEGGYHQVDGVGPQPTYCIWDQDGGDPEGNGIMPDGPSVYGLSAWADGIHVEGRHVELTTRMLTTLLTSGAIWNDDQRFEVDGTIEYCGPDALCSLFGLDAGDALDADDTFLEGLAAGHEVTFTIQRSGAPLELWTAVAQ